MPGLKDEQPGSGVQGRVYRARTQGTEAGEDSARERQVSLEGRVRGGVGERGTARSQGAWPVTWYNMGFSLRALGSHRRL